MKYYVEMDMTVAPKSENPKRVTSVRFEHAPKTMAEIMYYCMELSGGLRWTERMVTISGDNEVTIKEEDRDNTVIRIMEAK